jgi:hypothetical protein
VSITETPVEVTAVWSMLPRLRGFCRSCRSIIPGGRFHGRADLLLSRGPSGPRLDRLSCTSTVLSSTAGPMTSWTTMAGAHGARYRRLQDLRGWGGLGSRPAA